MRDYCPYCMAPASPGQPCPHCGRDPGTYQPGSHHFLPGKLLHERYLVGHVLGEGGFGITYLGLDTSLERKVAIKEYFPTFLVSRETSLSLNVTCYSSQGQGTYEKGRERFLQEARTMAALDGIPEIVRVLDHFPENNTAYIVMEFLEGETLKDLVAREGVIPAGRMLELLEPVLRAMEAMHAAGIIHRDISPDNLMVLKSGTVKLMDFGCARDIEGDATKTVTLKHGFAPREQYTGRGQGPWTDVYALCATVYYCLTGKVPPRATERGQGEQDSLIPPNQLGAALTADQEQALLKGLAVRSTDRWQSVADLYRALYGRPMDAAVGGKGHRAQPFGGTEYAGGVDSRQEQTKSKGHTSHGGEDTVKRRGPSPRGKAGIGAAACAAVLLIAALAVWGTRSAPTPSENTAEDSRTAGTTLHPEDEDTAEDTFTEIEEPIPLPEPEDEEEQSPEPEQDTEQEPEPAPDPESGGGQEQPPAEQEEPPAVPTQAELEALSETQADNGQYTSAAETCRQMRTLGYITAGELGEHLYDLGWDAMLDDEYTISFTICQEAMELGNLDAKYMVASSYEFGSGVEQDSAMTFQLYLELAQAGYGASVYYEVASAYTDGVGTAQDPEQAIYWWERYLETGSTTFIDLEEVREKIAQLEAA